MPLRSNFKVQAKTPGKSLGQSIAEAPGSVELSRELKDLNLDLGLKSLINEEGVTSTPTLTEGAPQALRRRVAMLVTHGMGQQVPYETLSAIGQALVTQNTRGQDSAASAPTVNVSRVTLTSANDSP